MPSGQRGICQLALIWGGRLEHIGRRDDGYNLRWPCTAGSAPVRDLCLGERRSLFLFRSLNRPVCTAVGRGGLRRFSYNTAPDASWPSCLLPLCCRQVGEKVAVYSDERATIPLPCLQSNGNGGQVRGTMPSVLAPGRADARIATPLRRLRRSTRGVT